MKTRKFTQALLLTGVIALITSCSLFNGTSNTVVSKDFICSNYDSSTQSKLPVKLIQDMVDNYDKKQRRHINSNMSHLNTDGGDAKSIWFDLETLKKFIYHIEKEAKNNRNSPTNIDKLGVRIYYASYPTRETWKKSKFDNALDGFIGNPITEKYGERHTLVLLPTINIGGTITDFDPFVKGSYESGLVTGEGTLPKYTYVLMLNATPPTRTAQGSSSRASTTSQNHGGLYPPYPEDGAAFTQ